MAEWTREIHGGNIHRASRLYGRRADEFLDFSANLNPLGMPEGLREILIGGLDAIGHYPDPECTELCAAITEYLGVPQEKIVVGNGASEVIFLLLEVLKPTRLLIPAPTFLEYARAAAVSGIEVDYMELKEEDRFKLDVEALIGRMDKGCETILLCNPNNPTSTLLDTADIVRLLEAAADRKVSVVLDEAFIELTVGGNANSAVKLLSRYDNLHIIRAVTKIFAIPGLRLGYCLGNEAVTRAMWERKMPWSVNTLACSVGAVLPVCGDFLQRTEAWLKEEKDRFFGELAQFDAIRVYKPQSNFILVRLEDPSHHAALIREKMAGKGILIRDASNFKFLDQRYIRLAVKERQSNQRVLEALGELL